MTDGDGFTAARKPSTRPTPHKATLGDFVPTATRNRFSGIERESTNTTVGSQPARIQPDRITTRAKPAIVSKKQAATQRKEELNLKKTVKATNEK